jgi:hypothetical protein
MLTRVRPSVVFHVDQKVVVIVIVNDPKKEKQKKTRIVGGKKKRSCFRYTAAYRVARRHGLGGNVSS